MPGIATHYIFGRDAYRELADTLGLGGRGASCYDGADGRSRNRMRACEEAFVLGSQGPDPYLFLVAVPAMWPYRTVGSRMHSQDPATLLANVHETLVVQDGQVSRNPILRAYGLGFMCHYLLDSAVHPLVYAQQRSICAHGVEGLQGRCVHGGVHATIETELDELMLTAKLGVTASEFLPHKHMLRCSSADLAEISRAMGRVAQRTLGQNIPAWLFTAVVHVYRCAQTALDSKYSGLRQRFDYLAPLGMASPRVLALSHHCEPRYASVFSNDDHIPWPHPHEEGEVMSSSFEELYDRAYERALQVVPAFANPGFGYAECSALAKGINFLGKHV